MTGLISIPPEVLSEILRQLPLSSLSSFCRTSKAAIDIADPLLYRHIEWTFSHDTHHHDPHKTHPIHLLFRTITRRPTLANHVKTAVILSGARPSAWDTALPLIPAPTDLIAIWLQCFDRLRLPSDNNDQDKIQLFREQLQSGNPTALSAIILASLPSLSTLTLDYTLMQQSILLDTTLCSLSTTDNGSGSPLKKVTVLNNLDSRIINTYMNYPSFTSVFSLPKLESLKTLFQAVRDTSVGISHANLPELKKLELTDHFAHASALPVLLAKTPRLEKLAYFMVEDMDTLVADGNGIHAEVHRDEWNHFAKTLEMVKVTLKTLRISVDVAATSGNCRYINDEDWVFGISGRRGVVSSLSHMENLVKLELPMVLLFGRFESQEGGEAQGTGTRTLQDVLPYGLKKLYLRDDYVHDWDLAGCEPDVVLPALESFLLDRKQVLGEVRLRLRLRAFDQTSPHNEPGIKGIWQYVFSQNLNKLEDMGRRAGVKITLHLRERSLLDREKGCVDVYNELIMYQPDDPGAVGEEKKGAAAYLKRKVEKRARSFMSNWEE